MRPDIEKEMYVDEESTHASPEGKEEHPSTGSLIWEVVRYTLIAAIIIIPIRVFVASPFVVSGNSMYPTLKSGEYLIVEEITKKISGYERFDIVILRYPNDPSKYFIKRIIGMPGETVTIDGGVVTITTENDPVGFTLDEAYVTQPKNEFRTRTLDDDEYFVMGDNRAQSSDSRMWGPVTAEYLDGKPFLRLLPVNRITFFPGHIDNFTSLE